MLQLPSQPSSLVQLFKYIFGFYPRVFKEVGWLVVLSATVHLINPFVFKLNQTIGFVFLIGFVLVTWFLFGAILWKMDAAMRGRAVSFAEAFSVARQRYIAVLFGNVIFFAIVILSLLVQFSLLSVLEFVRLNNVSLMIDIIFDAVVFLSIYFAIPLIVLDNKGVFCAFQNSAKLVWNSWWHTFLVMLVVLVLVAGMFAFGIMITGWNRMYLFTLYDFVYQVVAYPLIISATLVILNDLKIRLANKKPIGHGHH